MTKDYGRFLRKGGGTVRKAILTASVVALALTSVAPQAMAQTAPGVSEEPLPLDKNITVFPKRDMVTVDDAPFFANKDLTVKVIRDGVVIGKASGKASATGFFEINHPGGVCWGTPNANGIGYSGSTPNIIEGDVVEVLDANSEVPDGARAPVRDVSVTQPATQTANNAVEMKGTARNLNTGAPLDLVDEVEARIVNPDLDATADGTDLIGKRDVRAPGTQNRGTVSYTGDITYDDGDNDPNTWTATYTFTDTPGGANGDVAAAVDAAVAGQSRALSWGTDPATAERTGVTIYEHGEIDGPGFGGCPAGASYAITDAGRKAINTLNVGQDLTLHGVSQDASNVSVKLDDQDSDVTDAIVVDTIAPNQASGAQTWSTTIPAADINNAFPEDITTLTAEATFTIPNPEPGQEATSVQIGGEKLNIEKDLVVPDVPTATPGAGTYGTAQQVTLEANEDDATIRYTTNGSEPTGTSRAFSSQIGVSASQTIKAKVFDTAGNPSDSNPATASAESTSFQYVIAQAAGAPNIGAATGGNAQATVSWTPPANNGGAAIDEYMVNVVNANTNASVKTVSDIPGDVTSAVVDGLAMARPTSSGSARSTGPAS